MNSVVLKSESAQDTSNQVAIAEERESNNEEERKRAAEEAARRKAEEEAAKKRAEEEAARKRAEEEEAARKRAEEEAAKKRAEEEAARKRAAEEAARRKAEEEASKKRAEEERKRAEQEAARKKAEEEAARKTQNVSHPMLNNISDSESDCYEEATIVNNTQPFQFIHLPPPPVQPQSKQSTYRSPAPHSTPPSPPIEKEKGFIDKLLMNLRIRSGCHVALSVRIHL